jgi:hypothetical protein
MFRSVFSCFAALLLAFAVNAGPVQAMRLLCCEESQRAEASPPCHEQKSNHPTPDKKCCLEAACLKCFSLIPNAQKITLSVLGVVSERNIMPYLVLLPDNISSAPERPPKALV